MPAADVPAWLRPRYPQTGPTVAAALLAAAAVLLLGMLLVLPCLGARAPWFGWVLVVGFVATSVLCWWAPRGGRTSQLSVLLAVVMAVVACTSMWAAFLGRIDAGVSLLGLPVVFAVSQLRRTAGVVATAVTCASAAGVLLLAGRTDGLRVLDALLVCASLGLLAAATSHHVETARRLVEELEHTAAVDGLTGLANRRTLDGALVASLTTGSSPASAALVLVDLDHFKSVNDRYGHPVGDAALQHVARVLTAAVRTTDAVVGRFGGDELAVLLPGCSAAVASRRADEMVDAVRGTPVELPDGTLLALTVSVGVAHAPDHALDVRALCSAADAALYRAKREGRDRASTASGPATPPRRAVPQLP